MEWYGDEYLEEVARVVGERVEVAGENLSDVVKTNIGIQGTPTQRSKPGEFPRRQSGNLQSDVGAIFHAEDLTSYVGASVPHAKFLTHGTSRMAPREFLLRTLNSEVDNIVQSILGSRFTT